MINRIKLLKKPSPDVELKILQENVTYGLLRLQSHLKRLKESDEKTKALDEMKKLFKYVGY